MRNLFVFALALLTGCGAGAIREQAEEAHEDRRVVAIFPSHDTMAMRGDIEVQVILGEEKIHQIPTIKFIGQNSSWAPRCHLDETGQWATCDPIADLPRDQVFDLQVGIQDQNPLTVNPTTEFPDGTSGYMLNTNSNVTNFGEDASTADRVGGMFRSSDIVVVIDEYSDQPGEYTLLAGPVERLDNGKVSVRSPGLTFVKYIVVDANGSFESTPQSVFMPIFVDTGFVQVLIQNCQVSGKIEGGQIRGMKIKGDIPALSLVKLAEPLGPAANFVLGSITMDVDLDGDGDEDAAFFTLVSNAPKVELVQY